jgi:hypothetical protein
MTEAMNIKTTKTKVFLVTIVLVALVAAMAATAKPAEAATYCNSSASAPSYIDPAKVGGQTVIQFPSRITCTGGNALSAYLISRAQIWDKATGTWQFVHPNRGGSAVHTFLYSAPRYTLAPRINCTKLKFHDKYYFRTVSGSIENGTSYTPKVRGYDGTWRPLPIRYSSYKYLYC